MNSFKLCQFCIPPLKKIKKKRKITFTDLGFKISILKSGEEELHLS